MPKAAPQCLVLTLVATSAWAQLPVGPEFQVNSYTTAGQYDSAAAVDAAGNFVVVWKSTQNGFGDIFARRFDAAGTPIGGDFLVNSTFVFGEPAVAMAPSGAFVVVWDEAGDYGGAVKGQRYDATGAPAGGEFHVNTYITSFQYWGSVSTDADGNFVVVWTSYTQDGSGSGVFGQRFSSGGAALGAEFPVNSYIIGSQLAGRVAVDADGDFVVVWHGVGQDGDGFGVFGQRFSAAGARVGGEFPVNTTTTGTQWTPAVASAGNGQFVVAWQGLVGAVYGIGARRFDLSGSPMGDEFLVSQDTAGSKEWPAIAGDPAGNFVVSWTSGSQDGSDRGVFARAYDPSGRPLGPEFQVNTFTTGHQIRSSVAQGHHGDLVVTWESSGQESPGNVGVFGQRYSDLIFGDGFDPATGP
jgi:hypothetical protein